MRKFLCGVIKGCWYLVFGSQVMVCLGALLVAGLLAICCCCSCVFEGQDFSREPAGHSSPGFVTRRVAHIGGGRMRLRDITRYQNRLAGSEVVCQGRVLRTDPSGFFLWSSQSSATVGIVCSDVKSLEIVEDDIVRVQGIVVPGDDNTCIPFVVASEVQLVSTGN